MPTSKVIRPAVFDETGEHVIPADADLNLDPVSSDPDNYIVRGSDGGAFLNGDGVLSNDGENLLKTSPNDGKVTYPRSDAVSLINETVQPSLDKLEDEVGAASDKADKAAESAKKAAESAKKADEDAAAAQCTATQALNDAADAQADADKAQARADAAYDKASDAQCAAADALEKAQEAVDSLPEIADAHSSIVTAGDGIKVDQSKLGDHNVYQVSVKPAGADSGIKTGTDGVEVDLKSGGGLSKGNDGLGVDQQWLGDLIAKYCKDHMLFNQFKIVSSLPAIPDADVHTLYLIRNRDSSATDAGTKDSFDGWFIATTENGTQKWEEIGYKTDLRGYTHTGNTVNLTGDATGTGTVDSNGNVVVPTAVSHAASADKTTGGTVNITGYVSGSGSFDSNGNVTVDVVANIKDTPYTYYVGKTNARDYWGKDENGNQWGSTKDHPFASLAYAVNQTNAHIFPGNGINIEFVESGEYQDTNAQYNVSTPTYVYGISSSHPVVRGAFEMNLHGAGILFVSVDFAISHVSADWAKTCNGVTFIRTFDSGTLWFRHGCRMVIDADNYGRNEWGFITMYGQTALRVDVDNGQTGLILELAGNGTTCRNVLQIVDQSYFSATSVDADRVPAIRINAPSGTKLIGPVINTSRFTNAASYTGANYPHYPWFFDWAIHDCSELSQVNLGKFAYLGLKKNPNAGVALPGDSVGNVGPYAEYAQWDY